MRAIIDRFENNYAVLEMENHDFVTVPTAIIPNSAKEGSILTIVCEEEKTDMRRKEIKKNMDSIFRK